MGDLKAPCFALLGLAAQTLEGFKEKRLDVVRLQAARIGPFHVCTDTLHFAGVHGVVGKRPLVEQVFADDPYRVPCRGPW